jgi:hypothetical protein
MIKKTCCRIVRGCLWGIRLCWSSQFERELLMVSLLRNMMERLRDVLKACFISSKLSKNDSNLSLFPQKKKGLIISWEHANFFQKEWGGMQLLSPEIPTSLFLQTWNQLQCYFFRKTCLFFVWSATESRRLPSSGIPTSLFLLEKSTASSFLLKQ